jgi:hypothetical protein
METPSSRVSTDEIISAVAQLSLPEIEEVFDHVLALQAERQAGHLSPSESELLVRINDWLPAELLERLATLRAKREDETITDAEYGELTRLGDQAEELHAERLAALVELAKLRGVTVPLLLDQLGIHFQDDRSVHETERRFRRLVNQWRKETEHISSIAKASMHPAYQRIIGMGYDAIPYLLCELQQDPDHWFWALNAITEQDPAQSEDTFDGAVGAWLRWGKENGHL